MVYVYGRKRKASSRMGCAGKKPRRVVPTRFVRAPPGVAKIVKTNLNQNWTFTSASVSGYWKYLQFSAVDFPEWSTYAAVYDEYRVTNLKYVFRPKYTVYPAWNDSAGVVQNVGVPTMHLIVDQSSGTIPAGLYAATTENAMLENGVAKSYQCDKPFGVSFKPKVSSQLLNGSTAAASSWAPWIRTNDSSVIHNGLHAFIKQPAFYSAANFASFDIYITATIEFRGSK